MLKIKKSRFREIIAEEYMRLKEQEFKFVEELRILLTYKAEVNITDIFTTIRAVEGVTIVDTEIEARRSSPTEEKTIVKIKFLRGNRDLSNYVGLLMKTIGRLPGVVNGKVLNVKRVEK